jgi:PAS domain S-box-containing protein
LPDEAAIPAMGQALQILADPAVDSELLTTAFKVGPEGIALTESGRIVHANAAFAALYGYANPAELEGRQLEDLRPQDPCCTRMASSASVSNPSAPSSCEYFSHRKDGTSVRIESRCSSFCSHERTFLVLSVREVKEREGLHVVRETDHRFRTFFDTSAMGILQLDLEGDIVEANRAFQKMLGYSADELRGLPLRSLVLAEDFKFGELAEGQRDSYEVEGQYNGKGSRTGWFHLSTSLVRGPEGEPESAIAIVEDITERKNAERRLREAQKMEVIGRLVGGVAHDFNNLLTGIMLYCDLLVAGLDPKSSHRRHADEIRIAGEQGAALIQQLLAISRQQVVEPRVLCLNQAIQSTRNLLARLVGDNIELDVRLDDSLGNIKIDPAQVQQILFNLVLNARDAIGEKGRIQIETRNGEIQPPKSAIPYSPIPAVALVVQDNGSGMTPETKARLFEPFFTTKSGGRGNGLGLATVQGIVNTNRGSIEVESEPGAGARFTVRLPRILEPPACQLIASRFSPEGGGETILLVEDNMAVRYAADRILRECGYEVLQATNGSDALQVAENHRGTIDLLLSDIAMPGMGGRELARQLRQSRPEMKTVYVSAFDPENSSSQEQADPVVFFRKPFTGSALIEKVREVLDTRGPKRVSKREKRKREKP